MGLPAESLEFLTKGAKFSKPPIASTLVNVPGLLRLLGRESSLVGDFARDRQKVFQPLFDRLAASPVDSLDEGELLNRIEMILTALKKATYYSILAPLSFAARRGIFKTPFEDLDNSRSPEVESLRSLSSVLATDGANSPAFDNWLEKYGYLSEVGTDISIPRWRENPDALLQHPLEPSSTTVKGAKKPKRNVQKRLDLKNQVTEVYSRLLAHLRWHFLAIESLWIQESILEESGDIFFLKYEEIEELTASNQSKNIKNIIGQRRQQFRSDLELQDIPYIVYGQTPNREFLGSDLVAKKRFEGIGASAGQIEGRVRIVTSLEAIDLEPKSVLVVPYTDSGWSPLLARAAGIIAEVGGQLSHGAIIAREYGIPAVMDVHGAIRNLKNGQLVRIDGSRGIVEVLSD
jgi:pyruvate,water dikinase